jgi:hypothetical protein
VVAEAPRFDELVVVVGRPVVPEEAPAGDARARQEADRVDVVGHVEVAHLHELRALGADVADLEQPVRLELPLHAQVPLLHVRRREVRGDHLGLEGLELDAGIAGDLELRLAVVEAHEELGDREQVDVGRFLVPVAGVVELVPRGREATTGAASWRRPVMRSKKIP